MEYIVILAFVALFGYGLYKMIFKKETVAEAATEIKNEVVAEVKKVEEAAAPVVQAEVAKIVEEAKAVEAKVEEVVKTEVKKVATKAKARVKKVADVNGDGKVNVADVKAAAKKVTAKVTKPKKTKG
jgi:hypothetical protein